MLFLAFLPALNLSALISTTLTIIYILLKQVQRIALTAALQRFIIIQLLLVLFLSVWPHRRC